jgi:hypothetical protein
VYQAAKIDRPDEDKHELAVRIMAMVDEALETISR